MYYKRSSTNFKLAKQVASNAVKITILGDPSVGKSTIISILSGDIYLPIGETLGINFKKVSLSLYKNPYILHIWEVGGNPRYRELASLYYKNSDIILIVVNTSIRSSLLSFLSILDHIKKNIDKPSTSILIGVIVVKPFYIREKHDSVLSMYELFETIGKLKLPYWVIDTEKNISDCFSDIVKMKIVKDSKLLEDKENNDNRDYKCFLCNIL